MLARELFEDSAVKVEALTDWAAIKKGVEERWEINKRTLAKESHMSEEGNAI
jgi:hypothetical protein